MQDRLEAIATAVRDGDRVKTVDLVKDAVAAGLPAAAVVSDGLIPGMQQLGDRFKDGQAFLPEILVSARAMNSGLEELRPRLDGEAAEVSGTVILGTVQGDLHDIGKKLVGMLLAGNGFGVIDLGVDVSPEAFVTAVQQHDADIVALSSLLTTEGSTESSTLLPKHAFESVCE